MEAGERHRGWEDRLPFLEKKRDAAGGKRKDAKKFWFGGVEKGEGPQKKPTKRGRRKRDKMREDDNAKRGAKAKKKGFATGEKRLGGETSKKSMRKGSGRMARRVSKQKKKESGGGRD